MDLEKIQVVRENLQEQQIDENKIALLMNNV